MHFVDIAPTIVELAGGSWPTARGHAKLPPTPGISLVPAFARDGAVRHETLWWCHQGNQAIRMGDWKLSKRVGSGEWELYDLATDRCEMNDLAARHPDKVRQLADRWQSILDGFVDDLGGPARKKARGKR